MVYKLRVILDTKDTIFRDVEVKGKQTLWNLHLGIKSAFNLPGEELSSFYFSDDDWNEGKAVPLEDMSDDGDGEIMSDVYLPEAFPAVGEKMRYQYGFMDLWDFFCELLEIVDEKPAVNYPITVYRFGNVPLKAPSKSDVTKKSNKKSGMPLMDDEFGDFESEFRASSFEGEDDDFEEEEDYDYNDKYEDEED